MAAASGDFSCVLEPIACEAALFSCLRPRGPLSLFDLEALTLLTDTTILFDKVIFLDTTLPTIRYKDSPKTDSEQAQSFLVDHLKWDFFRCDLSLREYPQTPLYKRLRSSKLKNEYTVEEKGNVRINRKIPHPVIGYEDWSVISYYDKVNSSAAALGATVVHQKADAVSILEQYQRSTPALTVEFIDRYDEALKERFLNSSLRRHRQILHFAPLFLASAISNARSGNPEAILSSIAQMRAEVTSKYRSLCNELLVIDQKDADRVVGEIEKLLGGLAESNEPIPSSHSKFAKAAVAIFGPIASIIKIIQGNTNELGDIVDAGSRILSGADDMRSNMMKESDLYRRLNFFNRLHDERPTSDVFYDDLKRVFVEVGFSGDELDQFLGGRSPTDIYRRRRNL